MTALHRNNVVVHGPPEARPMVFAHGFGCDQNMWRFVWPEFAEDHRIVLFDHVGAGGSDAAAFDRGATRRWTVTPTTSWRSAGSWT